MAENARISFSISPYCTLLFSGKENFLEVFGNSFASCVSNGAGGALWMGETIGIQTLPIPYRTFSCFSKNDHKYFYIFIISYNLDVICNRSYFGEIQENVPGQCNGEGISAPRTVSFYQWSVPEKNDQSSWGNTFVNTPPKFLGLSWEF